MAFEKSIPAKGEEEHTWLLIPGRLGDLFPCHSRLVCGRWEAGAPDAFFVLLFIFLTLKTERSLL